MRAPWKLISETLDVSREWGWPGFGNTLRSLFRNMKWWVGIDRPIMDKTVINYDYARQLYRNDGTESNLGAGFCRPIVDLAVEYIGLPRVTSDDDARDTHLNECIHEFWAGELQQMFRDSLRDSKSVVRFRQPLLTNPLHTDRDRMHGVIEMVSPESVQIVWSPVDHDLIEKAVITHWIDIDAAETQMLDPSSPLYSPPLGTNSLASYVHITEHQIIEILTPETITFFDVTANKPLDSWGGKNKYGFVPLWPIYNEYDVALGGGQSEFESILPFIKAFHEVLLQSLQAHKYHSAPKLKFKLRDVGQFIKNNFPDVVDESGRIISGATIKWQGREIMFLQTDEDIDYIEAKSVLNDSRELLNFLIDCICIASETPKWAIMKVENVSDKTADARPFEKKIERKRNNFAKGVQMLCKMALVAYGQQPETVRITWPAIRLDDLVNKGQAIQQLITGLDVAKQNHWVADETVVGILGGFFPEFRSPATEIADAANNYEPPVVAPAAPSATQGQPPPSKGSNGSVPKAAAKRAVATTTKPSGS